MIKNIFGLLCALVLLPFPASAEIKWQPWSEDIFVRAQQERKLVILDLEAVWCHWCHVMEQQTYSNPKVSELISAKFIAVKVDQDSRPDLSNRYKDYGWPATIFFSSKGQELDKEAGFIEPEAMISILKKLIANPIAIPSEKGLVEYPVSTSLSETLKQKLTQNYFDSYDPSQGSLKLPQKYLDPDSIEYGLRRAALGSSKDIEMVKHTLDNNLKLLDKEWGGVYQYSTQGDWDHPHFEKIMAAQASNLKLYAMAYGLWKNEKYLEASTKIHDFLKHFLWSAEGAFYTSQDADLKQGQHSADYFALSAAEREKLGVPRVDKNIYARENGLAIQALAELYAYSQNELVLQDAKKAAEWVLAHRADQAGGFRHAEKDLAGPYLADNLAMGQAFLELYLVSAERLWLTRAVQALDFIASNFIDNKNPGAFTSKPNSGQALSPIKQTDENIALCRFANLMQRYTGKESYRALAQGIMKYLSSESVALEYLTNPGVLMADEELSKDPMHLTIVGPKEEPQNRALFLAALKIPSSYKRLEWWDKKEGALMNPDVQYPEIGKGAAFVCANKRCSLPIFNPDGIATTLKSFAG